MFNLLQLLADCQPKSRQFLTAVLAISPEQLENWAIQLLTQGLQIERTPLTLRLIPQSPLLNANQLKNALLPYNLHYQAIIDSTNQYLLDNIPTLHKGDLCVAEYQSAGRGRRGRQWQSPFASQLIMSFYWTLEPRTTLDGLSIIIGMAIFETFQSLIQQSTSSSQSNELALKWPNDVLLNQRKLAGILVEIGKSDNGLINLVIGIGINLRLPEHPQIDQPWAQLTEALPQADRNQIIPLLVQQIYQDLHQFEQQGISETRRQQWAKIDTFFGKTVKIVQGNTDIIGIEQGIDQYGHLILSCNGELRTFNAGDVSLRDSQA